MSATQQACSEQLIRLVRVGHYPDVKTPEGARIWRDSVLAMCEVSEDDAAVEALGGALLRSCKFFPTVAEIIEKGRELAEERRFKNGRDEYQPPTEVCEWCGGSGFRSKSDNGYSFAVRCSHRAPDERVDAKQRASGEARV